MSRAKDSDAAWGAAERGRSEREAETALAEAREGLRLAGEIAAWSAGAAATAETGIGTATAGADIGAIDGANGDNGKDINGNGVEKLEERPAFVTDRIGADAGEIFTDRICAAASSGIEAAIIKKDKTIRTARNLFLLELKNSMDQERD